MRKIKPLEMAQSQWIHFVNFLLQLNGPPVSWNVSLFACLRSSIRPCTRRRCFHPMGRISEAVVDTLRYPLSIHYNFTNPPHWTKRPAPRARTNCTLTGLFGMEKLGALEARGYLLHGIFFYVSWRGLEILMNIVEYAMGPRLKKIREALPSLSNSSLFSNFKNHYFKAGRFKSGSANLWLVSKEWLVLNEIQMWAAGHLVSVAALLLWYALDYYHNKW